MCLALAFELTANLPKLLERRVTLAAEAIALIAQAVDFGACRIELRVDSVERVALPRERGDPFLAVLGRPRLVLEQRQQPLRLPLPFQDQRRPDEAASAQADPRADELDAVRCRPLEAVDLQNCGATRRGLRQ